MLNAQQVIDRIHGSYQTGSKHGLRNTQMLMELLDLGSHVPVIHIAGTNGKGSTCAMLESILRKAGYRTGMYTSPFLQMYQERIRLDGQPLGDDVLVKYGVPLLEAAEALAQQGIQPTPFELGTALALSVFQGEQVDAAIVEVGLGGRLDPTNVVKPVLCGITAIGMDHMNLLGHTLEEIAAEKAGIIKPGVPVVCHPAEESVKKVFARYAEEQQAPLHQLDGAALLEARQDRYGTTAAYQLQETWREIRIPLPGEHQQTNAMVVLGLVEQLRQQGWSIPERAVREGMAATVWPARLEWCGRVLIDGAHNPQGVAALAAYVHTFLQKEKRVLLTGVLADKLQPEMLQVLASIAPCAVTVTPDNPRAMPAEELSWRLNQAGGKAQAADSLESGLALARMLAGDEGVVIAAGSLYFAGALRTVLNLPWKA